MIPFNNFIESRKLEKSIFIITFLVIVIIYSLYILIKPRYYIAETTLLIRKVPLQQEEVIKSTLLPEIATQKAQLLFHNKRLICKKTKEKLKEKYKLSIPAAKIFSSIKIEEKTGANIIKISARDKEKKNAILIANSYSQILLDENRKFNTQNFIKVENYIKKKLNTYKIRLEEINKKLQSFNKEYGSINLEAEIISTAEMLEKYKKRAAELNTELAAKRNIVNRLNNKLHKIDRFIIEKKIIPNPLIETYETKIIQLEHQVNELKERYDENTSTIIELEEKIKKLKRKIRTEIPKYVEVANKEKNPNYEYIENMFINEKVALATLNMEVSSVNRVIEKKGKKLKELEDKQIDYSNMKKEKENIEKICNILKDRLIKINLEEKLKLNNIYILDKATDAYLEKLVNKKELLIILTLAIFVSIITSLSAAHFDKSLTTPTYVKRYLDLEVIGSISDKNNNDIYQQIWHTLHSSLEINSYKNILFTSILSTTEKSNTLIKLGYQIANRGEKVILVDFNLRAPTLYKLLNKNTKFTLTDVFRKEISINRIVDKVLQKIDNNIYILGPEESIPTPLDIIKSETLKNIIELLQDKASFILYDSPPLNIAIDAYIIANYVDVIIFVINGKIDKKTNLTQTNLFLQHFTDKPIYGIISSV